MISLAAVPEAVSVDAAERASVVERASASKSVDEPSAPVTPSASDVTLAEEEEGLFFSHRCGLPLWLCWFSLWELADQTPVNL